MLCFAAAGRGRYNRAGSATTADNQESVMGESFPGAPPSMKALEDRLDSWKEIAAYLNRDVTTVQRWEKREGMPVHRHLHDRIGSVYASRTELEAWVRGRNFPAEPESGNNVPSPSSTALPPLHATLTSRIKR